jgi:hypothetical protein
MKTTDLIYIGVGAVAGYLIYTKLIKKSNGNGDFSSASGRTRRRASIQKAGGMGKDTCVCHGKIIGSCFNITPWSDCCKRKCHDHIWRNVD